MLLLAAFGVYSTRALSELRQTLGAVDAARQAAAAALGQENEVLSMRSDVAKFLTTSNETNLEAATRRTRRIGEMLTKNIETTTATFDRELLVVARKALDEFTVGLFDLAALQSERNQILQQSVVAPIEAIDKIMFEVMRAAYQNGDATTAFHAGSAIASLAGTRSAVEKFLQQGDTDLESLTQDGIKQMGEAMAQVAADGAAQSAKRQMEAAQQQRLQYIGGIKRLVDVTRRRDATLEGVVNQRA